MTNAAPQRILAPPLPFLAPRRRMAWVLSFAVHAAVLGLGLWLVQRVVTEPSAEPQQLVYVKPVAPPPPLGAPMTAPSAPVISEPIAERPKEIPKPERLVVPRKPKRITPPAPPQAAVPHGEADGSAGGVTGGVVGGESGGTVGGVVGGHGDAPVPASQVEHEPVAISRQPPRYPSMARARNIEGGVLLRIVVDRDGRVEDTITVVESAPLFDAAAVEALRKWRFEPGRDRDGRPVRVLLDVPIRFQLR